jgi:hypothetical protein
MRKDDRNDMAPNSSRTQPKPGRRQSPGRDYPDGVGETGAAHDQTRMTSTVSAKPLCHQGCDGWQPSSIDASIYRLISYAILNRQVCH